jgi:hypothetical protein
MGPVAVGDARFDPVGQDDAVGLLAGVEQAQVDDDAVAPGFAAGGAIVFRLPQAPPTSTSICEAAIAVPGMAARASETNPVARVLREKNTMGAFYAVLRAGLPSGWASL